MSGESKTPNVTPYEGTSLSHAHFKVIDALSTPIIDPKFVLRSLRVFYGATSRRDIIDECEKTFQHIMRNISIANASVGYTHHDRQALAIMQNVDLDEQVMQFYFQITTLLNAKGFTEFMKAKPREESRPTI